MKNNEIMHYGIKGMRWGVRRTPEELQKNRASRKLLDSYNREELTNETLSKYKNQYSNLNHVKIDGNTKGELFSKDGKIVGMVNIEKKSDGTTWIQGLEVFGENKGRGLSRGLLDIAVNKYGADHLSVRKTNTVAKKLYEKYGFKTYDENVFMAFMKIETKETLSHSEMSGRYYRIRFK